MPEKSLTEKRKNVIKTEFRISQLPSVEKQKIVGFFAWLIQEDRKQNPEFYQQ